MRIRRILAALALVAALVLAGLWLRRDRSPEDRGQTAGADRPAPAEPTSPRHRPGVAEPGDAPRAPGGEHPRLTADGRRQLLAQLARARHRRRAAAPAAGPGGSDRQPVAPLDLADKTGSTSDWERRQLDTLNQLLGECYDLAAHDDPDLAGTLGVQFTIAGEPEIGGLVDDIEIMEGYSTIEQATLRECVTESLYALELDPPPDGVRAGRQITLRFEPD
jgi:hypothetical protein